MAAQHQQLPPPLALKAEIQFFLPLRQLVVVRAAATLAAPGDRAVAAVTMVQEVQLRLGKVARAAQD